MEYNLNKDEANEKMDNGAVVTNSLRGDNAEWFKIYGILYSRTKNTIGPYFKDPGNNLDASPKVKWKVVKEFEDHVLHTSMNGTDWFENNRNWKPRTADEILDKDGNFILYSNL